MVRIVWRDKLDGGAVESAGNTVLANTRTTRSGQRHHLDVA
jgi:hypothetical protein